MKAKELLKVANFKRFIFYGAKQFNKDIEYNGSNYSFSKINWSNVEKFGSDYDFYNYSQAFSSLLVEGHRNANAIANIIDKVLKLKIDLIDYENETLYIYVKWKEQKQDEYRHCRQNITWPLFN